MGLLNALLGTNDDPFTVSTDPALEPTPFPGVDAPVITLMLLIQLDYDKIQGYRHHDLLMQYTYLIEERLEDADIRVNRYEWDTTPPADQHDEYVHSEQFLADLHDGFRTHSESKPVVHATDTATYGGDPLRLYRPSGYTDLYIEEYFDNTLADRENVEALINEFTDELPGPASNNHQYVIEELRELGVA